MYGLDGGERRGQSVGSGRKKVKKKENERGIDIVEAKEGRGKEYMYIDIQCSMDNKIQHQNTT